MNVHRASLRRTALTLCVVVPWLASAATAEEAARKLSFRSLGPDKVGGAKLQVFVEGTAEPLFEEAGKPHWSKPVSIALPADYRDQPIVFRLLVSKFSGLAGYYRVLVADVRITDANGRLLNLGGWHYHETEVATHFQGFVGDNNILLEKPFMSGQCKPQKKDRYYSQFTSDRPRKAPDIKIGYDDVVLLNDAGEPTSNYDVRPEETIGIRADVHNLGSLDANSVKVGLYDTNGKELDGRSISLACGAKHTVEFKWTAPMPQRSVFLRIAADQENKITEVDEYNNHSNRIVTGPHPFLWFYGHDIPTLKDNLATQVKPKAWWNDLKSTADSVLGTDYKGRPRPSRPQETADLAFTYLMTGDDKYAKKAKESLLYLTFDAFRFRVGWSGFYYGWAFDWVFDYLEEHDGEDLNNNHKSDLLEIQDNLATWSSQLYSGLFKDDHPVDFGGAQHQIQGESAAAFITVALSLLGYNKTLTVAGGGPDVCAVYHGADHFAVAALGHYLGYPDPSPYGKTSFWNEEGIPAWFGPMYGGEGMYEEGSYYAQPGLIWITMAIAEHLGIDMRSQPHFQAVPDFWIKTMAPDRTYPFYAHSCREPIGTDRFKLTAASKLYNKSRGNVYTWYWKDIGEPEFFAGKALLSILTFDQELYDKAAAPDTCFDSPTQFLPGAGMAVLRSDWSRDATYLMILGEHRPTSGLYTSHNEGDATAFNLFAKGEYLAVSTGDGRLVSMGMRLEGGDYADVDGQLAWGPPWTNGWAHMFMLIGSVGKNMIRIDDLDGFTWNNVPGEIQEFRHVLDKAYIENCVDTEFMDYLEVRGHLGDAARLARGPVATIDIANVRRVLFPGQEYFIIVDELNSLNDALHKYSFQLHLAGKPVDTNTTCVDRRYRTGNRPLRKLEGTLTVGGGEPVQWDSDNVPKVFSAKQELTWKTKNPKNEDIALKVFFVAPQVTISVERGDGDWHQVRNIDPYINPYVQAYVEKAKEIKLVTFLYPWKLRAEAEPAITDIEAKGGYAGRLTIGDRKDVILVKNEAANLVAAGEVRTDAQVAFASRSGTLDYYFIRGGSWLAYEGKDQVTVSSKVNYLVLKYDRDGRTFKVKGEGSDGKVRLHDMTPGTAYQVTRDGRPYSKWSMANGDREMIVTTDLGEHTFEVKAQPMEEDSG